MVSRTTTLSSNPQFLLAQNYSHFKFTLQIIQSTRADTDNYSSHVKLFAVTFVDSYFVDARFYKKERNVRQRKLEKLMVMTLVRR